MIHIIDTRGEVLNALGQLPPRLRPWMKHFFLDTFWSQGLRARSGLETIGRAAFKARRKSSDGRLADLLQLLFSAKDPNTGRPLADEDIVAESISFIVGGSDTTSSTMTHFIDLVSRDVETQDRLQDELDEAYPTGSVTQDWVASDSVAGKLPFLNATLKEVMRLRPTSSTGLERVVPKGGREIAGRYLPGGVRSCRSSVDGRLHVTDNV